MLGHEVGSREKTFVEEAFFVLGVENSNVVRSVRLPRKSFSRPIETGLGGTVVLVRPLFWEATVMGGLFDRRRAFLSSDLGGAVVVGLCAVAVVSGWLHGWAGKQGPSAGRDRGRSAVLENGNGRSSPDTTANSQDEPSLVNSIGMRLILIPAGEFVMGSLPCEELRKIDEPQHRVRITRPFYLGAHEVTVQQYRHFVEETDYRTQNEVSPRDECALDVTATLGVHKSERTWRHPGFPQEDQHPVVYVSWHDAVAFCRWLGRKEGREYRLPTEAEWEYACRARTVSRFSCGDAVADLFRAANVRHWVRNNHGGVERLKQPHDYTSPVGTFEPNPFGLYDMHGNVWEWCSDWHDRDYYSRSETSDPKGPTQGDGCVVRGGSFRFPQWSARSANRAAHLPVYALPDVGFRVAMSCP